MPYDERDKIIGFFNAQGEEVGCLLLKAGVIAFQGKATESAILFFEEVAIHHDKVINDIVEQIQQGLASGLAHDGHLQ
jgi:hypothetical protein